MGLVLVGSGGFAEELLFWVVNTPIENLFIGYLGFKNDRIPLPYLGSIDNYVPRERDEFILGIGRSDYRMRSVAILKEKKAVFKTFIHPTALISRTAVMGEGVIIGPFCLVSANVFIGEFVFMNNYSSVGHHSKILDFAILSPYAAITGNCEVGEGAQVGTHGTLLPKVKVRRGARVAPGSAAYRSVPQESVVLGVPGKVIKDI